MPETLDTLPALPAVLDPEKIAWPTFSIPADERLAICNGYMPQIRLGKTGNEPPDAIMPPLIRGSTLYKSQESRLAVAGSTRIIRIFYVYAHEDDALRKELEKHLGILRRSSQIIEWHDREIPAGAEWEREVELHLNLAGIILLLVSPDFVASDYCYGVEMKRALERHESGEVHVIPIILRPLDLEGAPFSKLQMLPSEGRPITSWLNRDEAFSDVAKGIRKVVKELTS